MILYKKRPISFQTSGIMKNMMNGRGIFGGFNNSKVGKWFNNTTLGSKIDEKNEALGSANIDDYDNMNKAGKASALANASNNMSGIISGATDMTANASDKIFDHFIDKNDPGVNSFGIEQTNQKSERLNTAKDAVGGALRSAGKWASKGKMFGPIGMLIGGAAGAIFGAAKGWIGGHKRNKKLREKVTASNEAAFAGERREQEGAASEALFAQAEQQATPQGPTIDPSMIPGLSNQQPANVDLSQFYITGKEGVKIANFMKWRKEKAATKLAAGGKITKEEIATPGKINVVAGGKMHRENNDLGKKDKGIPIINKEGIKEYEIEAGEVVFRQEISEKIDEYVEEFDDTSNREVLTSLGKILTHELLHNTLDNYGKFKIRPKKNKTIINDSIHEEEALTRKSDKLRLTVGKKEFEITVAEDDASRVTGLLKTDKLPKGEGMLFKFEPNYKVSMTMEGMKYPLDMVFIYDNKVVDKIYAPINATEITSEYEADSLLEINAGESKGIRRGNKIEFIGRKNKDGTVDMADGGIPVKGGRQLLDDKGRNQMNLLGGERVFSRISTKRMFELAKAKKYNTLGRYMYREVKAQEKRPVQYSDN